MKLSVIIPTRNRAALLQKALCSLVGQTLSQADFEVIVVDNGSTDDTFEVVASLQKSLGSVRYFLEPEPGLHVGRHRGLSEAGTELLVFADDDIEAFPTWLQAIEASFHDDEVFLVGGKCLPRFEADPPEWLDAMWSPDAAGERILGHLSLIDLGDRARAVDPHCIFGCNFAVRRSVLLEAGGFHPDAMPQELIRFRGDGESHVSRFLQARGGRAQYDPLASVHHFVPADRMTLEYFCRRAYNQGISDSYTAIRRSCIAAPDPVPSDGAKDPYRSLRSGSSRMLKTFFRSIRGLFSPSTGRASSGGEESPFSRQIAAAYRAGYNYHQAQVSASPELLAWVLKPDYRETPHLVDSEE